MKKLKLDKIIKEGKEKNVVTICSWSVKKSGLVLGRVHSLLKQIRLHSKQGCLLYTPGYEARIPYKQDYFKFLEASGNIPLPRVRGSVNYYSCQRRPYTQEQDNYFARNLNQRWYEITSFAYTPSQTTLGYARRPWMLRSTRVEDDVFNRHEWLELTRDNPSVAVSITKSIGRAIWASHAAGWGLLAIWFYKKWKYRQSKGRGLHLWECTSLNEKSSCYQRKC